MNILLWIRENWYIFILFIGVISMMAIRVYEFLKQPNKAQLQQIQEWLVYAVARAEEVLGSGTGKMKLKYVYDMFVTKFPAFAMFISYEKFVEMTEKALKEFKEMIAENPKIKEFYAWDEILNNTEENQEEQENE
jgi:hypothetical protein